MNFACGPDKHETEPDQKQGPPTWLLTYERVDKAPPEEHSRISCGEYREPGHARPWRVSTAKMTRGHAPAIYLSTKRDLTRVSAARQQSACC